MTPHQMTTYAYLVPVVESLFSYVTPAKAGVYSPKDGFLLLRLSSGQVSQE